MTTQSCGLKSTLHFAILLAAVFTVPAAARAQVAPLEGEQAIEAGRRALRDSNRYPWYDRNADDLRRVDVGPDKSAESLNRNSQWQYTPRPPPRPINFTWPRWLAGFMKTILIILGVVVVGLLVWLLVWAFLNREAGTEAAASEGGAGDARGDVDRVENLPFQVKRPRSDLQGEAERNFREGNYREAIIYLYSHLLVQLDRHQVIRLAKGKTNRQYLREVRKRPELLPIFEATMNAFEDVFFGDHALTRSEFENCWNRRDEFQQLLEQGEHSVV